MSKNTGKKAIVMGATSGIGLEVALLLASKGWSVGIAGRRTERLEKLQAAHENIGAYEQIDVNQTDATEKMGLLIEKMGGVDLYLHSSGIGWDNPYLLMDKELATVETNALGFTRLVDYLFNYMAAHNGGQIAAISSIAGTKGLGVSPSYSATKAFQQHYLESLTQLAYMRKLPIHITDIRPGFVDTDLIAESPYPLKMKVKKVAKDIVRALEAKKKVVTIDWKFRLLVRVWRLIPRSIWVRMTIK